MTGLLQPAKLIPVSEWVYNLYQVKYWTTAGMTTLLSTVYLASTDWHIGGEAEDNVPSDRCEWITWELERENVGHPRVVGQMYGQPVYESGRNHGRRLKQLG